MKRAEKKQIDAFFTTYLAEANGQSAANIGFPLIQCKPMMSVENFMTAGKQLKYITDDLASAVFQKNSPRDRPEWKAFVAGIEGQQAVARALLADDGILGGCTINLAAATELTRSKDEWRGTWRDMKLIFDGATSETIRSESESDQKIGDVPVQQKIELRLIRNAGDANSPTFSISTAEWGALWLIQQHKGERDKVDPKTWLVEFPVAAPGANGFIRLKLKFERALPELDKWPTR